jgi:ABC-type phosphate transport system substrate-binding protein
MNQMKTGCDHRILMLGSLLLALMVIGSMPTQAQISIVVAKSSHQTAGAGDLRQMFSGAKLTWSAGEKVAIADQPEAAIGKAFYDKFIGKSLSQVRTEWMKLVLSGQAAAPKKCSDDDAVKAFVRENPNAVGFISSSAVDESVKELYRVSATGKTE